MSPLRLKIGNPVGVNLEESYSLETKVLVRKKGEAIMLACIPVPRVLLLAIILDSRGRGETRQVRMYSFFVQARVRIKQDTPIYKKHRTDQ